MSSCLRRRYPLRPIIELRRNASRSMMAVRCEGVCRFRKEFPRELFRSLHSASEDQFNVQKEVQTTYE